MKHSYKILFFLCFTIFNGLAQKQIYVSPGNTKALKKAKATMPTQVFKGKLKIGDKIFWRVDAVRNNNIVKGEVWSFTVGK
tara:strand:+ start:19288 stop:19530 length:243 start_codon:yes stop_codon:yes gene_type:complete